MSGFSAYSYMLNQALSCLRLVGIEKIPYLKEKVGFGHGVHVRVYVRCMYSYNKVISFSSSCTCTGT